MSVTETLNEGLKRQYVLTIDAASIAARVDTAIAEVAPKVRMPGFRPGKVPGNLIRKMHGPALRGEAVTEAVNEAVNKLIADSGLRPAIQPKVDLRSGTAEGEDVTVDVALEVLPQVPDTPAEGIALERLVVEVDDAAIDAALRKLAEQQKSFEDAPAKHKAEVGDQVVMDYAGTVDGVAFDGGTGEDMDIELGSGRLIPGFEDGLAGVKAGDEKTIKVTFPADYPAENLAGKDAEFAIKVKAVKIAKVPAVDDTLATNLGLDNLEALRTILKDQVEAELKGLTRTHMKRKLLDHLAATHDFDVPPSMVDAEFEQIWRQVTADATDAEKVTLEAERADYVRIAERRVRLGLLLSDIGQKNGLTITQSEMNRLVAQEAQRYPGQEAEVQRYFAENAMAAAQLRAPLFEEKVVDFLLDKAVVTERTVTREELEAAIASEDETPTAASADPTPAKKPAAKKAAARKPADDQPSEPAASTETADTPKPARKSAARKPAAAKAKPAAEPDAAAAPETAKPKRARKPAGSR